jgi:hypothetical protein
MIKVGIDFDFKINKEPSQINSKRDLKAFIEKLRVIESFIPDDFATPARDVKVEDTASGNPGFGDRIIDRALVVLSDYPNGLRAAKVTALMKTCFPTAKPAAESTVASVMRRKPYANLISINNGVFSSTEDGIKHANEVKMLQGKSPESSPNGHNKELSMT